ncbi:MAG: 2-phospho-L-lactate guanylyltransferase [Halolamina sp.]
MEVLVPFATDEPKSRLRAVFSPAERLAFASAMLADVLDAVAAAGPDPTVLAVEEPAAVDAPATTVPDGDLPTDPGGVVADRGVDVRVDERPLTTAINAALAGHFGGGGINGGSGGTDDGDPEGDGDAGEPDPVAVVVADLALATPASLRALFAADGEVVVAPGLGGGTSALVVRHPAFRVDYHGASCRDHRERAAAVGADLATVDSRQLATDVDEPADLAEVLLHGDGAAAAWLRAAGVSLAVDERGRVGVERDGERF